MQQQLDVLLWADDHHGIYCPQYALQRLNRDQVTGIQDDDWSTVLAGPDQEWYWESWANIIDSATIALDGNQYRIDQDGIVWLVPLGMSYSEDKGYYWATDEDDDCYQEEIDEHDSY